jgi:hypothetical protein
MLLGGQEVRVRIEPVAVGLVVIAVVPYLALKLSWLTGAGIGVRDETVLTDLRSTRMVVANKWSDLRCDSRSRSERKRSMRTSAP